ncbi:MAG: cell division protein SepF [Candidatus Pacearchaeota archaeon]
MILDKIKEAFSIKGTNPTDEYLEIDLGKGEEPESKVFVKLFSLKEYDDVNDILNSLREGYTIAMIDIKSLKQKDSIELKRAISKIKKTVEALEGNIAGFGDNTVIATPPFAKIHREPIKSKEEKKKTLDY